MRSDRWPWISWEAPPVGLDEATKRLRRVHGDALLLARDRREAEAMTKHFEAGSAHAQIVALAKDVMKDDGTLSESDAIGRVLKTRPALAKAYAVEATVDAHTGRRAVALEVGRAVNDPMTTKPANGGPTRTSQAGELWDVIEDSAIKVMASDPTLTKPRALARVVAEHPEWYDAYAAAVRAGR